MENSAVTFEREASRLHDRLRHVRSAAPEQRWTLESCRRIAPLTLEIERLKRHRNAIILAHSYVAPEISYGVADFRGDSYYLAARAREARARVIVFVGVVFMAETAKIVAPQSQVVVPDRNAGCSLADSIDVAELSRLKSRHPGAVVVCYINTTAAVKALCDVCVTSANAARILAQFPHREILFVPDQLMGQNLREQLARAGIETKIVAAGATCEVHEHFTLGEVRAARLRCSDIKIVAHPECMPDVVRAADFTGSTEQMMRYVEATPAPCYQLLTESGLIARLEIEHPDKTFVGPHRACPHMKRNTLEKVLAALDRPRPGQNIELDEDTRTRAGRCLQRMFELAEK